MGFVRPKICRFFENLAVNHITFAALHSADKYSNEQQIFGLNTDLAFRPKVSASPSTSFFMSNKNRNLSGNNSGGGNNAGMTAPASSKFINKDCYTVHGYAVNFFLVFMCRYFII